MVRNRLHGTAWLSSHPSLDAEIRYRLEYEAQKIVYGDLSAEVFDMFEGDEGIRWIHGDGYRGKIWTRGEEQQFADLHGQRFDADGNKVDGPLFGKVKPKAVTTTGDGTRGSRLETDGATKVLSAEEKGAKDKERLNKIYKLLGVDRAQRNAASKALVDVSRYIDEGGKDTISKKNIGSTISKAISSFDKRLDKADQLKEAAGVMMAKNYLEGGDRALDRNLKEAKLRALNKEADPSISNLKAVYKKAGVNDAAGAAAKEKFGDGYGGSIMSTKDFNKQMKEFEGEQIEEKTILDIATNAVAI